MEILTWTYILVGLSFALYIGITIYTSLAPPKFIPPVAVLSHANGHCCRLDSLLHRLSVAGIISFALAMMALFT
jgi:cation/acetate symporter